jgi:hypothetical protein
MAILHRPDDATKASKLTPRDHASRKVSEIYGHLIETKSSIEGIAER